MKTQTNKNVSSVFQSPFPNSFCQTVFFSLFHYICKWLTVFNLLRKTLEQEVPKGDANIPRITYV